MSANSNNRGATRSLPIAAVLAAVFVLIAFLGWQFYAYFGPHSPAAETKPLLPQYKEANDWITQKARESQGDVTKLSPKDQKELSEKTRGMGAMVLKNVYEQTKH